MKAKIISKLLKIIFILFWGTFQNYFAQEDFSISDKWDSKYGAGGGLIFHFGMPNLKSLNKSFESFKVGKFDRNFGFMFGGLGYAYIPFLKNVRIGGLGAGMVASKRGLSDGYEKEVEINLNIAGFTIEYSLPFTKNWAISTGVIIGASGYEIIAHKNKSSLNWDDIWKSGFDSLSASKSLLYKITNDNFSITPMLNIDIPFEKFFSFRFGFGYVFSFDSDWKANQKQLYLVPSNLKCDHFFASVGILAGFFVF